MKAWKVAVLLAGAWVATAASAGGDPAEGSATGTVAVPPRPAPLARPRPNTYAPDAALLATRSTVQQREERVFIRQSAVLARFETQASELARERAQAAAVRAFADDLYRQQSEATVQLQRLLHARGMALPMLENTQRKTLQRLARLNGARFDREYLQALAVRQQRDKVDDYQRALNTVADPAIRSWVERQLPLARQHMDRAERLAGPPGTTPRLPPRSVAPTAHAR